MHDPNWKKAMFEEMRALVKNDTWDIVSRPSNKNMVGCKWVYSTKHTPVRKNRQIQNPIGGQGLHTDVWCGLRGDICSSSQDKYCQNTHLVCGEPRVGFVPIRCKKYISP
jgi:hypothetical protein